MDFVAVLFLQVVIAIATIVLFSMGLAVVFGMMRVINLAHGEFIMLGAFTAVKSYEAGLNLWAAMLVAAPAGVALYGVVVERVLIRRLYGRLIDTLLATWGLSLFTVGAATMVFGNTTRGVPTPSGTIQIGQYGFGAYNLVVVAVTLAVVLVAYWALRRTNVGLIARGTMQDAEMVAALGYNPRTVYAVTFATGAGLAGLAGGVLAPLTGVIPSMGTAFVAKAFITVISGGSAVIFGTTAAAALLGKVNQATTFLSTPVIGEAAMLLVAILLLRIFPNGLSSRLARGGM
ncbi:MULTISPECIES: branched-chain amino acid ABC transporter permease [unclassified Bradyrhizobium]|uniref:ABC transporter permease subunit n=1 Tax=unclassified Bradyrhizobium TaxID=2631580 RepID=UPI00247A0162|nr:MULTISPECIES: branched-chain amino acid ABC transporter permease [unclassified Bradyrhizobium]WGS18571.1 branched-chain amino acid ABC transporter permease [Bradyrhizobium sp. ISRA463]WGS25394.1 branched-chain amino acid ABC transporter permease [Bradyrhizobium sp. ISRA464]